MLLVLNKVDLLDPQALHEVERVMAMSNGRQAQGSIGGNVASKRLRSVLEQVQMAGGTGNGPGGIRVVALSCRTGRGADNLAEELCKAAEALVGVSVHQSSHESVLITRHRHRQHLQQCVSALLSYQVRFVPGQASPRKLARCQYPSYLSRVSGDFTLGTSNGIVKIPRWVLQGTGLTPDMLGMLAQVHVDEMELAAEDLRAAARALGSITSAIDAEEILESIFTEFCIGK